MKAEGTDLKLTRLLALLLGMALLLTGCGSLFESEYVSITPHTEQYSPEENENALTAENYLSLKNAILSFVENGVEDGVIRVYDYSGDVEEDLEQATYEVAKSDPLGAYAVDYITQDSALIVSYYEIRIHIKFRRTLEQIESVQRVTPSSPLESLVADAMANYDDELTVRLSYYNGQDPAAIAQAYYLSHPSSAMEFPQITVNLYPESGNVRILEVLFAYSQTSEELKSRQSAVETSLRAAQEYVRYRDTETAKLQLLYTYLQERFSYESGSTTTPVYSFLCEGIADSAACARSLQALSDEVGLECYTVEGSRDGKPYFWNIVCVDGMYCHADLCNSLLSGSDSLTLYQDDAMASYSWDRTLYPACP